MQLGEARLIEAEQALPDFPSLVKELIDNSIDARATNILLKIDGLSVTVRDNGSGIADLQGALQPHATSKLHNVEDMLLGKLKTIGFRGEALAAVVTLAETVEIKTACAGKISRILTVEGTVAEFEPPIPAVTANSDHPQAPEHFTEIRVRDPFYRHPVRLNHAERNRSKHLREIVYFIFEYSIVLAGSVGFQVQKLSASEPTPTVLLDTTACSSIPDVICRMSNCDLAEFEANYRAFELNPPLDAGFRAHGFLSNPLDRKTYTQKLGYSASQKLEGGHAGRSGNKYLVASVNGRPINVPKLLMKRLDSVYRRYTSKNCGGLVIVIQTEREIDINMSVNKRHVLLPFEKQLAMLVEEAAEGLLRPKLHNASQSEMLCKEECSSLSQPVPRTELITTRFALKAESSSPRTPTFAQSQDSIAAPRGSAVSILSFTADGEAVLSPKQVKRRRLSSADCSQSIPTQSLLCLTQGTASIKAEASPPAAPTEREQELYSERPLSLLPAHEGSGEDSDIEGHSEITWNTSEVTEQITRAIISQEESDVLGTDLLSRLRVVGAYRKSFIICYDGVSSLYLVDQHAADEKFWFEKFNNETQIGCQPLLQPVKLKLSTERLLVLEHLNDAKVLERNGYRVVVDRSDGIEIIHITHMPVIKGLILNEKDLIQLLQTVDGDALEEDDGQQELCNQIWNFQKVGGLSRPPRVWNIIAMKSCKSAVKFGEKLSFRRMEQILANLTELKHPWNCPHGRPTIKKLC